MAESKVFKEIIDRMTAGTGAAEVSGAAGTGAPAEAKRKREAPRVIFVTNNYHVFRTGFYAHKQHIKVAWAAAQRFITT